jgi:hypothetical protein
MAELSSLYTNHTLTPQGNSLVLISIKRLSELHSYSIQALVIGHLKISTDPTRNRNQNLVSSGTVPQSTALHSKGYSPVFWFSDSIYNFSNSQHHYKTQSILVSMGTVQTKIQTWHPLSISNKHKCWGTQPSTAKGHNHYCALVCETHL